MTTDDTAGLREELAAERAMNALMVEEAHDLEIAAEDREWRVASMLLELEFTRSGLDAITRNCEVMAIASPMIKRGITLRTAYVWGQGVSVQARSGDDAAQDVNAVVQAFWDSPDTQMSLSSAQAHEQNERTLATRGNWAVAFFTNPVTGKVRLRRVPFSEIKDKITDPNDRDTDWFFLREWSETVVEAGTLQGTFRRRRQTRRSYHPALFFQWPVTEIGARPDAIDGVPIEWNVPILHMDVNRPEDWTWGVPDVYAALPWARAYEGFLTDWARLVKALSKFAWRLTGDKASKAQRAADKIRTNLPLPGEVPPLGGSAPGTVGQVAAMGPGVGLEAIPKSGATIDSDSGRPLAAMVAAALGVSVVSLLADPGVTGARAVAESLDKPDTLAMGMRQSQWRSVIQQILTYVIQQAVLAPQGPLKGTVTTDTDGVTTVTLTGDVDDSVEVVFPPVDETDPVTLVQAIVAAETTGVLPKPWIAKALLRALGEQDVDEVIDPMIDDKGNWIDPETSAGDAAANRFRNGQDPADVV